MKKIHEAERAAPSAKFLTVGKPEPRVDGRHKVTGKAIYAADRTFQGIAWGKVLRSPLPHARITKINVSRAKKYPGVLAVLTADDVSNQLVGRQLRDMPILAQDRVRFIGEKVAAIAAESPELAEKAANLIEVEYDELRAVFDPAEAIANAVYDAIGIQIRDLPITSEKIYSALKERRAQSCAAIR